MDRPPPRIAVAVRPHLVGSAISASLATDGRFELQLLDASADWTPSAAGAAAVVCSRAPAELPVDLPVLVLGGDGDPSTVEVRTSGRSVTEPYRGLRALADRLADALEGRGQGA